MLTRTHWPAVWAVIAAGIVAAAYVGKLPPAIPLLREEFRLSLVAAGWVNSTFNTLAVTTAVFFGALASRYGALRCCGAGLVALMLGGLLGAAAPNETVLFASRIVEGAGFIVIAVSAPTLITAVSAPRERNLTLGLWSTYLPFGASLTMLASPFLLGSLGWRGFWLVIVLTTLACMLGLWRSRGAYGDARSGAAHMLANMVQALRQPGPWWLALAFGCYTLLGSWLVHRAAPRGHMISLAFLVMAACACGIFSSASPDSLRSILCMLFMFAGGTVPAAVLSGSQVYARGASQISSLQGLIVQIAQLGPFFGPPLVAAVVSDAGSWNAALWVLLAASGLGALFGQLAVGAERARARPAAT